MANLFETIRTMRAKGINTPRPGTDDKTVPTVQGDIQAGKVEPNPADDYKAVKNKMAQVKHKIIDENQNGETNMPQDKVSASFLEAIKQVKANATELAEKKKKAKPDFLDLDKDGNKKESMKKAAADCKMEEKEPEKQGPGIKPGTLTHLASKPGPLRAAAKKELISRAKEQKEEVEIDESDNIRDLAIQAIQSKLKKAKVSYRDPNAKAAKEEDRIAKQLASKAKMNKEEVEIDEAVTVLLRKGGKTKRMRYNPNTIARLKAEGWTVVMEDTKLNQFVERVKSLFDINEEITFEEAVAIVEEEQAKRGRGRPASAATLAKRAAEAEMRAKGQEPVKRGRGRPKKGSGPVSVAKAPETKSAEPAKPAASTHDDAGDTQHILVQLRKASTNEPGEHGSGKNTIKYLNGSTGQVTAAQARSALQKHDELKSSGDRFKAQRRMGGSHEGLTGFLSGKEEKSTSKPKVSLAQPGWNKK